MHSRLRWDRMACVIAATALAAAAAIAPPVTPIAGLNVTSWSGKSVLFISAHPDDIEGFAGGLVARLQDEGSINISYLVVTSGNAGGSCYDDWGPRPGPPGFRSCEKEEIAFTRRREMVDAASYFGVPRSQVFRLGVDDGMVLSRHETDIRRAITAVVRAVRPRVVVTHYPYPNLAVQPTCNGHCAPPRNWDDMGFHPDHQRVGWHVMNAAYGGGSAVGNDLVFDDLAFAGVGQWQPSELYFWAIPGHNGVASPTHFLELDGDLLARKTVASSLHRSQYQDDMKSLNATTRFWAEQSGAAAGVGLAELYVGYF